MELFELVVFSLHLPPSSAQTDSGIKCHPFLSLVVEPFRVLKTSSGGYLSSWHQTTEMNNGLQKEPIKAIEPGTLDPEFLFLKTLLMHLLEQNMAGPR